MVDDDVNTFFIYMKIIKSIKTDGSNRGEGVDCFKFCFGKKMMTMIMKMIIIMETIITNHSD